MYCSSCGSLIKDGQSFCANCGTPVSRPVQPAPQPTFQPAPQPVPQQVPVYQQPVSQPVPQPVPQPAPAVYQQPVQPAPQAVPAPAAPSNTKGGPRRTCFVVGLITCILLILETFPVVALGAMMFVFGPITMALFGADTGDLFLTGLLVLLGGVILLAMAVASIVLNGISSKVTAKRPASKCRSLRMVAAVLTSIDAAIVIAPVIGFNEIMSDAEFLYVIFGVTFIMAIIFLVLSIITNSKEKKLASVS